MGAGYRVPPDPRHDSATVRRADRLRPTLRLRLTLLNGVLLVGAGLVLMVLAWLLLVRQRCCSPTSYSRAPGWCCRTARGRRPALAGGAAWRGRAGTVVKGLLALLVDQRRRRGRRRTWWPAGRCGRCSRSPRPRSGSPGRPSTSGSATSGADDEVAELAATFDAMLDRIGDAFEPRNGSSPTPPTSCGPRWR